MYLKQEVATLNYYLLRLELIIQKIYQIDYTYYIIKMYLYL